MQGPFKANFFMVAIVYSCVTISSPDYALHMAITHVITVGIQR